MAGVPPERSEPLAVLHRREAGLERGELVATEREVEALASPAAARGEIRLSPELAEYKLFAPQAVRCWRAGTGYALADWLRSRGHEPQWLEPPRPAS